MNKFHFRKNLHLTKKSDFDRLQKRGRKLYAQHFLLVVNPTDSSEYHVGSPRLGIAITKKIEPSAVKRNKIRRRIKEVFRLNRLNFTKNFDILVVARKNISALRYVEIENELIDSLRRAKLI